MKGTAKLAAIVENRKQAIEKVLETKAVYTGDDLSSAIVDAIKDGIEGAKDSDWEGQTCNYYVNVGRKQMAESRSAGRYVTFADGFTGTARQYSRVDGSAGEIVVNITDDNNRTLKEVTAYTVAKTPGVWNEYVYITGQGNYKTTRGDDPVQIKVAVKRTGTVNLAGDDIVCEIEDQPFPGVEHKPGNFRQGSGETPAGILRWDSEKPVCHTEISEKISLDERAGC